MKKIILLVILGLSIISHKGISQDFLNLDFEYGVYKSQPRKWSIEGEGEMYDARLDSTIAKSGNKSLHITVKNSTTYAFLSLPGKLIAGKDVQVEGYILFKDAGSLKTMFAFRDPNGGKSNISPPVKGNNDEWEFISYKASFPDNYSSHRLLIALISSGTGDFWMDHVKIKINGQEYGNGSPDFREPTKMEIKNLDKIAIPIKPFVSDADTKDFTPLDNVIGNSIIVGLGENSHGSSTIYKLKLRMVKYLVEKKGFSIFALESPIVEADRINDYVLYGKGTLNDVIENLTYPSWQTREMIDIVQWIKSYNQKAQEKVEFRGFDMQDGMSAFKVIEDFARINDTALSGDLAELKKWCDEAINGTQQWNQVCQKSESISQYLALKDHSLYKGIDKDSFLKIQHYMEVFVQSLSYRYQPDKAKSRDEYMAQNIDWLVKNSGRRKIILSADNTHVTKANGKMGNFLKNWYAEKYMVFGFTYGSGSYSAYGPEKYYQVHPPYVGTYEYLFEKSKLKNFFLDLRTINDIPLLDTTSGFRSIGSRPQETTQFMEIDLKKHFDVVVYLENSTHTTPLAK